MAKPHQGTDSSVSFRMSNQLPKVLDPPTRYFWNFISRLISFGEYVIEIQVHVYTQLVRFYETTDPIGLFGHVTGEDFVI